MPQGQSGGMSVRRPAADAPASRLQHVLEVGAALRPEPDPTGLGLGLKRKPSAEKKPPTHSSGRKTKRSVAQKTRRKRPKRKSRLQRSKSKRKCPPESEGAIKLFRAEPECGARRASGSYKALPSGAGVWGQESVGEL